MLGLGKGVSLALAGWLWADILLGLFVTFLAANSVGAPPEQVAPQPTPAAEAIDPTPLEIALKVNGRVLLAGDVDAIAAEQARIVSEVRRAFEAANEARKPALVLAYGSHESPSEGDRLARLATGGLRLGTFSGAALKTYHELVPGDLGTKLAIEVYLYRR